ncbi:hypothetical protein MKW94_026585, partial [Papaver nudicaule]|nr:hypothetical protein [Papaver nudicaule]
VADNDSVEVVPPDEQRCHKSNGRGWRCKKRKRCHEPSSFCDQHYNIHARENKKRRKLEATHYP